MDTHFFLNYLIYEKRYSPLTIEAYKSDLLQFREFLNTQFEIENPSTATRNNVKSWVVALVRQNLANSSIQRKVSTLKSYYKFLKVNGEISVNPASNISAPGKAKSLFDQYSSTQIRSLIESLPHAENFETARSRCIILTLYGLGLRRAELLNIKLSDIDLRNKELTIIGKRSKKRIVPIPGFLREEWEQYLFLRRSNNSFSKSDYMFLTDKGSKLYPVFVNRLITKHSNQLEGIHPHAYRHSIATHLLEKDASILAIRDLLGHSSLAATQVYTKNSIDQLKDIYRRSHPLAEDEK